MSVKPPDPRDTVSITRVVKRGDWYEVEGRSSGRKASCAIPAPSIDGKDRRAVEALIRRSLYGSESMDRKEPS